MSLRALIVTTVALQLALFCLSARLQAGVEGLEDDGVHSDSVDSANKTQNLGFVIKAFLNSGLSTDVLGGVDAGVGDVSCSQGWSGIGIFNHDFICTATDLFVKNPSLALAMPDAMDGWTNWKNPYLLHVERLDLQLKLETSWKSFADIQRIEITKIGISSGTIQIEYHAKKRILMGVMPGQHFKSNAAIVLSQLAAGEPAEYPPLFLKELDIQGVRLSMKRKGLPQKTAVSLSRLHSDHLDHDLSSIGRVFKFVFKALFRKSVDQTKNEV